MIAPMKKAYIVLEDKDRAESLLALRALGLVHLELGRATGAEYERYAKDLEAVSRAANIVSSKRYDARQNISTDAAIGLAYRILEAEARRGRILEELGVVDRELQRCASWGNIEPTVLSSLATSGHYFRFYSVMPSRLDSLPAEVDYVTLERRKGAVRIAAYGKGEPPPDLSSDFAEFRLPEAATEALNAKRASLLAEGAALADFLKDSAVNLPSLKAAAACLGQRISFETARSSFVSDSGLCAIKGFVPLPSENALVEVAKRECWALILEDPEPQDATPTKIENGRLFGTIKPVFDFLGIVPAYTEYEISPWFLVFFSLFTAMIFGDGGYGGLMFIGWLALALTARKKGEELSASLRLFLIISVLTMVWGTLTGTWFSIRAEALPSFLRNAALWPISNANPAASKNIQVFCFLLGTLQLAIARVKNLIRDFPNPKCLAQVGSLSLIAGMLFLVLNLVVDSKRFPLPPFAVWLVAAGFAANMIFGAYEGNILKSAVEGLKNVIPTFLSSVGVFADIVSYIRLWALGLAGSSLAAIINGMGGGMLKPALIGIFGVIILVFGHGLNIVLSVLSVVVHAIRLNILEFSCNHLGMQWSGIAYDPFRETYKEALNASKGD
jgi:V/A-type H+-transporting ATPase subunit I